MRLDKPPPPRAASFIKLIKEIDASRVAEIGVFEGEMIVRVMSDNSCNGLIKEYHAIDPYSKYCKRHCGRFKPWALDIDVWPKVNRLLEEYSFFDNKVRLIRKWSVEASKDYQDGYFDIVFIDANHTKPGISSDIKHWYPKVRDGGILCGHDYGNNAKGFGVTQVVNDVFGDRVKAMRGLVWAVLKS